MKWILSLCVLSFAIVLPACGSPLSPPAVDYDTSVDVAGPVGRSVDDYFRGYTELLKARADEGHAADGCEPSLSGRETFADRIAFAVEEGMQPREPQLSYVASAFRLPARQEEMVKTSLLSHWFCPVSAASLKDTLRKHLPSAPTIAKAQSFTAKLNELRRLAFRGDSQALLDAHRLWSRFMMCLAYTESLTTADTGSSRSVASRYDLHKPEGVKFYLDPAQKNPKSRFNIGLYQFAPDAGGNVQACLRAWNARYPGCPQNNGADFRELSGLLATSRQSFNAFCGVVKITDMFAVQANTRNPDNTDPANRMAGGKMLDPDMRCVTPFFRSGASYNHFGPLQNSTGSNLKELLDCTMAE
jgi:hypothetical protein